MPNGGHPPYRLRPDYGPPSPVHTSDAKDTWTLALEALGYYALSRRRLCWRLMARWLASRVLRGWRLLVRRARLARMLRHHPGMRPVARHIAEFLDA